MAYSQPSSDKNQLYINVGNFGTIHLTDLLQQAQDHFGPCELSDLIISPEEWTKVDGCSCCYENWLCVTLV